MDYQNGISIYCEDCKDKVCQYNIILYSLEKNKRYTNNIKYLKPSKNISYTVAIKNKNIIDLNILSGEAYFKFDYNKVINISP